MILRGMDKYKREFPPNFFWGASTSAHQVEGGNHNQWTVWELGNAKEQARSAHQRLSWLPGWRDIKETAENPESYVSGAGVEHYKRYKEDFKLIKELNLNSFRFSIEWSRIEPKEGEWDEKEIEHYRDYIVELRKLKIEPFLNIWHGTLPVWFYEKGGFKHRANLKYWERFIQKVGEEFCEDVTYVLTINEPNVYTTFCYLAGDASGKWPPQEKSVVSAVKVYVNLISAHKRAYRILKRQRPSLMVGMAHHLANIQAKRPHNFWDGIATQFMRFAWNWWFLNRTKKQQDFIGFNYYFSDYYRGYKIDNPKVPLNDMGWYMEPEGLYPLLLRAWAHYRKPIVVTENGLADASDQYRGWWLDETIVAMERALSEGVDLRGYFHWSLLDNFEWGYGWWPKFGLIEVDREHAMKRTIRPSGHKYAKVVKEIEDQY